MHEDDISMVGLGGGQGWSRFMLHGLVALVGWECPRSYLFVFFLFSRALSDSASNLAESDRLRDKDGALYQSFQQRDVGQVRIRVLYAARHLLELSGDSVSHRLLSQAHPLQLSNRRRSHGLVCTVAVLCFVLLIRKQRIFVADCVSRFFIPYLSKSGYYIHTRYVLRFSSLFLCIFVLFLCCLFCRSRIRRHYLRSWFTVDAISSIPWDFIVMCILLANPALDNSLTFFRFSPLIGVHLQMLLS
jgi:hypothetical protein